MASDELVTAELPTRQQAVLATIGELLVDVIGEEYVLGLEIGMETSFNADLELESIEFVALAAMLREHYGARVDFVAFLAEKEVDEIIALTVGELVRHIDASLTGVTDG
jgi:acyl carrier protein